MQNEHEAKMKLISALASLQQDHVAALEWLDRIDVSTDRDGNQVMTPVWAA